MVGNEVENVRGNLSNLTITVRFREGREGNSDFFKLSKHEVQKFDFIGGRGQAQKG